MNLLASKKRTHGIIFWLIKVHVCRIIIVLKQNQLKIRATVIIYSAYINIVKEFMQKFSIQHFYGKNSPPVN